MKLFIAAVTFFYPTDEVVSGVDPTAQIRSSHPIRRPGIPNRCGAASGASILISGYRGPDCTLLLVARHWHLSPANSWNLPEHKFPPLSLLSPASIIARRKIAADDNSRDASVAPFSSFFLRKSSVFFSSHFSVYANGHLSHFLSN